MLIFFPPLVLILFFDKGKKGGLYHSFPSRNNSDDKNTQFCAKASNAEKKIGQMKVARMNAAGWMA